MFACDGLIVRLIRTAVFKMCTIPILNADSAISASHLFYFQYTAGIKSIVLAYRSHAVTRTRMV